MRILGLSAFYHDSAAALIEDGRIIAAAQEERFSRRRHDAAFPAAAIRYCLEDAGITASGVDAVVFYDKPFVKFERLIETYLAFAPRGFRSFRTAMPVWLREKLFQKDQIGRALNAVDPGFGGTGRLLFSRHHLSHAASAFYPSPFDEAVVLTMDGVGEWATTSVAIGRGRGLQVLREIHFPHSLGLLYSAVTQYAGFRVNSGEYKLMGLAPYGQPRHVDQIIGTLIDLKPDGSFRLNMDYFDHATGLAMTNRRFHALFGRPVRDPEAPLRRFHADLAASVQVVLERAVVSLTRALAAETGIANLCLAGGVALNCVANARLRAESGFANVWVQPAAGDAGGALGAALAVWHLQEGGARVIPPATSAPTSTPGDNSPRDAMRGAFLGPAFDQARIEADLTRLGARFTVLADDALIPAVVASLTRGDAVGWFQGRMEFGPRALGNRSILADPRDPAMQRRLNLQIKNRESFRPFAPAILADAAADWFTPGDASPYMLFTATLAPHRRGAAPDAISAADAAGDPDSARDPDAIITPRAGPPSPIPAVIHLDHSARLQTVHPGIHGRFHGLLSAFAAETGCPVLVNTSFNVRGEPVVCTPEDAFRCFMGTGIDTLAIGNCLLTKTDQDPALAVARQFAPD
ncbi:carbamoyltransferase (plasmid) [Tistrella bauzanensis]|uniref:carbamoyltransferase family protein n=1 Tax=Tistrella TaxID=171436 RepID=UPI0031F67706